MRETKPLWNGPADVARGLAERIKVLRLIPGWTQATLAHRAGVTTASYRRFETTGKGSLDLFLKVTHSLGRLDEVATLLEPPPASSISELEARAASATPKRKRGVR